MDSRLLTVFSTLLILFENYRVWSQAIQPTVGPGNSEFSMPTLIKAFAPPWDPKFPNYGNFPSCPPPMPPPIVLADGGYGGKNKWFNFLLLLLALRKNKSGNTRCGGCNGGCSESCGCIDSYDGCDGPYDGGCDSYGYDSGCCSRCGRKCNCGCGGGCNGGCESGCDSGCGGGCDGGCGGGCDGGCGCGCNGGCGGGCKGGCGGGCDGSCGGGCHGRHESEHTSEVINTIMPYPTAVYELPVLPPSPPLLSLPTGYGATTLHDTSIGSSLGIINNLAPLEDIYTCHPTVQTHPGRSPNEVHLIIKTECL